MASFYTNEGDNQMLSNEYLLNQKLSSFHHFGNSGEMGFIPATSLDFTHDSNHHGLSLSLGSQEPSSLLHFHSGSNQYNDNSTLFSLLDSVSQIPQNNSLKHVQHYKYLEVARDLLDELVSVQRVSMRIRSSNSISTEDASRELAVLEHHQLQDKMSKLMSMLDEVDRRYKQYRHQMQELASSFDAVAGPGASPQYTSLAFRTISCQFRSLSDAIKKQIISAQKGLGVDSNVNSHEAGVGVLSRLRCVDQQLRQQRFGVMRQAWRPQRGLPENAVSVLRAWLFEHFLHPYPKDSEKVVLAREAGLTRSQVANWFINARVRLWKPMIEEMYKEEFGFEETKLKSSPDHMMTAQETSTVNQLEFQETFVVEMKYGNG